MSQLWTQHALTLPALPRGFHLITREVSQAVSELPECRVGLLQVFLQHTSASLTLNENADSDVRHDFETHFNRLCPDGAPWFTHTCEGPDDMPAHLKAAMLGFSVSVPVQNGRLALGTWQGIYLGEHRDHASPRRLLLTLHGQG